MNRHAPIVRVARGAANPASVPGASLSAPLPDTERRYFESKLQHDFSGVRLHTGRPAAQAAAQRGARAFTDGSDIAFGAGRYQPGTPAGRALLGHELTHVAQQGRGGSADGAEARAQQSGRRAAQGETVPVADQGGAGTGVQCDDDEKKEAPAAAAAALQLHLPHVGDATAARLPTFRAPRLGDGLRAPLALPGPYLTPPGMVPPLHITPPLDLKPIGPPVPPDFSPGMPEGAFKPSAPPELAMPKMKAAELLAPFAFHGVSPATLRIDINSDRAGAFRMFNVYLPPGLAATSADMFLGAAYQSMLERDYPTAMDLENRRYKAAHPDELAIPPLPILSSSSLTSLYEWITNKKNTNKFYLP